jgi:transcriptional regulator with XRE-family HTH domain
MSPLEGPIDSPIAMTATLGENIRAIRHRKALTQEALAEKAKLKKLTLRQIENGKSVPRFQTIQKIARALNVTPEDLAAPPGPTDKDNASNHLNADAVSLHPGQLRSARSAAPERAFFGVGRVTVAVPLRAMPGRRFPVLSSEDDRARRLLGEFLSDLSFKAEMLAIPPDGDWHPPAGDVVAICGPLNSAVTVEALLSDPVLAFDREADTGLWTIRVRETDARFVSPMDDPVQLPPAVTNGCSDIAYVGRLAYRGRPILIIAGIHAIGSVGALHYLTTHLPELYATVGTQRFSMVVGSEHSGETILRSELLCPPRIHG